MARKKLGEILIEDGLINENDLRQALIYKDKSGYRLGTALVALRIIAEWQLTETLGKALNLPVVDLAQTPPRKAALQRIPARLAERFDLIPLLLEGSGDNQQLVIAMSDPLNRTAINRVQNAAGCPIQPVLANLSSIQRAIRRHYHGAEDSQTFNNAEKILSSSKNQRSRSKSAPSDRAPDVSRFFHQFPKIRREKAISREESIEYLLALEIKFRSLLHLMLKKKIISEQEYARTLRHFIDARVEKGV